MKEAGVNNKNVTLNHQYDNRTPGSTEDKTAAYFSQLPAAVGMQLYQAYKMDFDLFGYDPFIYINLTHQNRIKVE